MAASTITPTYLSSLFGGSLPTSTANTAQVATADTSGLGSKALVQQIMNASQPLFQQQQTALTDDLANAGIVGGSAAGAGNDLATQQIQQLLGTLVPAEQTAQQTQLGADEYNASAINAGNQYNASALNQNGQYNTTNALNAGQYDAGTANTLASQIMGYKNQDYLQQLNNQLSLAQGQQSGQTNAFQPIYQQASSPNFSGLAGAFGSNAASTANTASNNTIPSTYAQNFAN